MSLTRWRHLHPFAVVTITAVLLLFVWVNVELTRDDYVDKVEAGFRGGVRQGFPMTWWDAGNTAGWISKPDQMALSLTPYGGVQLDGAVVDLAVLLTAAALVGAAGHLVGRRCFPHFGTRPRENAARSARLSLLGATLATLTALCLLWINLQVDVSAEVKHDGVMVFQQRMGWPLTIYSAHDPYEEPLVAAGVAGSPKSKLAYLKSNLEARYRFAHWYEANIALNLLAGVMLVSAAACCCEWRRLRTPSPA